MLMLQCYRCHCCHTYALIAAIGTTAHTMYIVVFAAFYRLGIACSKADEDYKANGVKFRWHFFILLIVWAR